jgi:subtilisin family serine protease
MKTRLGLAIASAAVFVASVSGHSARLDGRPDGTADRACAVADFVPGQLVVKLKTGAKALDGDDGLLGSRYDEQIVRMSRDRHFGYLLIETAPGSDLLQLRDRLAEEKWVQAVSLNYRASMNARIPNEQFFFYQYALQNTGQVFYPEKSLRGTVNADIQACEGWDWSTSSSDTVIAIVDSGIALFHEDLKNKVTTGYDFVNDDDDPQDDNGHGTFVASLAAAETDNGIGIAGVGWSAMLMPVKVLDHQGNGTYLAIAAGIKYAADQGAKVINLSLGGSADSYILKDACQYAFDKGCVLVAAAGDSGGSAVQFPAAYDALCLAVGASDANDTLALFSNRGPQVDVVAPGVSVFGASFNPARPTELRSYDWGNGTSLAAAHVSGAVALLTGYKPLLTNLQAMTLIRYTADDVNGGFKPGVDEEMGYGRINLQTLLSPYTLN